jgi:hypothetical protein
MADLQGHFGWFQTPAARNFARLQGVRIGFFFQQSLQKQLYRDLKWKKSFFNGQKPIPVGFFTKSNSSEQNIYINRRFQRCCASQNKTRKIKTNSNSILRYFLKIFQLFYNINGV